MAEGKELGSNGLLSWSVLTSTCETDWSLTRQLKTLENSSAGFGSAVPPIGLPGLLPLPLHSITSSARARADRALDVARHHVWFMLCGSTKSERRTVAAMILSGEARPQLCCPTSFDVGDDPNGVIPA